MYIYIYSWGANSIIRSSSWTGILMFQPYGHGKWGHRRGACLNFNGSHMELYHIYPYIVPNFPVNHETLLTSKMNSNTTCVDPFAVGDPTYSQQ